MLPLNGPASYLMLPSSKISMALCPPTCRSLCPALHDCHSHWLPSPNTSYRVFSSRPELWLNVPKLSRSCILRGWDGLLTQSTWLSCGLSSGHSPPPCWLLQSCGNALETAGQQQHPKLVILFCFHSGHPPAPSSFGFISCYSLNILYLNILNYIRV